LWFWRGVLLADEGDFAVGRIPIEALTRIFALFAKLDHSATRAEGGLRIKLALSKGLLVLHGGTISFDIMAGTECDAPTQRINFRDATMPTFANVRLEIHAMSALCGRSQAAPRMKVGKRSVEFSRTASLEIQEIFVLHATVDPYR
jgi:hypothetical protein